MLLLNKKYLCIAFIILGTNFTYANLKEDITFLNELYKSGKYEMAKQESKKFIVDYPESKYNKNISLRLAKIYFIEKNYKESEAYFYKYLNVYKLNKSEKNEVYSYLYEINMILGNIDKAQEFEKEISKNKKNYEKILYKTGKNLLNSGKNIDSIREFLKVIELKGEYYTDSLLYLGMAFYNNHQYKKSLEYLNFYNNVGNKEKKLPLLIYLYGSTYYKLNDLSSATQYFEKSIKKYPKDFYTEKAKISLMEIYINKLEVERAISLYSDINNFENKKLGAKILGDYFLSINDYKKAIEYYEVIGDNKKNGTIYTNAYAYYKLDNYEKAIKEFNKIKKGKYFLDSRYYEILAFYKLKKYKKVLDYEKYLEDYQGQIERYLDMETIFASSYYELENFKKSYEYYKKVYMGKPELVNLYKLIVLANDCNDGQDLELFFIKYREKFKEDTKYKKNIYLIVGNYYYKVGKKEESINLYKEYLEKDKSVEIANNFINILVNEKKYTSVINYINMFPETDENIYLKGIAYMGVGKYNESNKIFNTLKNKENLNSELKEKLSYNIIKNYFLWEKYKLVEEEGRTYLESSYSYKLLEILDRMGLSYYRLGEYSKARNIFSKLFTIEETKAYAKFQIAETYFAEKNYKKAKEEYDACYNSKYEKYKEEAKYWSLNCDLNLKDYSEYLKNSEEFLKEFSDSSYRENILSMRGEIFSREGNKVRAIKEYENLYKKTKDNVIKDGIIEKIINLYDNQPEKKIAWIERFYDKYKKSYYKAIYYREKGEKNLAKEEEKVLLESSLYKDYAILNISEDEFLSKNYDKAMKGYNEIRNMESSLYKDIATYRMGEIYYIKKDYQNLIRDFSKLIVLYPNSSYVVPAKLKISDAYFEMEDYTKSEKGYKEVLALKNNKYEDYIVEKLLFISLKNEKIENAKKYYDELKKINVEMSKKYDEFFKEEE